MPPAVIGDVFVSTSTLLLSLFPNLSDTLVIGPPQITFMHDYLYDMRAHSEEEQKAHVWLALDRFVCDAEWAFAFALQCPIRRMDIRIAQYTGGRYLAETLRSNSPRHLHLTVELKACEGWGVLDGLFPTEATGRLTHLVILVEFEAHSKWKAYLKGKRVPWTRLFVRQCLTYLLPEAHQG